jgi:hypothetical protein
MLITAETEKMHVEWGRENRKFVLHRIKSPNHNNVKISSPRKIYYTVHSLKNQPIPLNSWSNDPMNNLPQCNSYSSGHHSPTEACAESPEHTADLAKNLSVNGRIV